MSRLPFPVLPRLGTTFQPPKPPWAQDMPVQQPAQDQFGLPQLPFARPQQQAAPADPTLTPEEESSLLGNVLGGVQYVGETIDKPGAAIRGVISGLMGGKWGGGLLNLIPLSDTFKWTNPQDRVYGRDLLEQAGVVGRNRPGLNVTDPGDVVGDVAGFATEVLLDPLTMVTGPLGSVTKAGQAITKGAKVAEKGADLATAEARFMQQAAGKAVEGSTLATTPAAMASQIREGQRGLIGFKLPWQSEAQVTLGAGSEMAAKALEKAAYGTYSPLRPLRGLFSQSAGGAFDGALQRANDIAFGERQRLLDAVLDIAPVMRETHNGLDETFRGIQEHFQTMGDASGFDEFSRAALEVKGGVPQGEDLLAMLRQHAGLAPDADLTAVVGDTNALADKMYRFFDTLKRTEQTFYDRYRALGGRGEVLEDAFTEHFGRRANAAVQRLGATDKGGKSGSRFAFWMRRSNDLRDLPGGSETINRITRDMGLWGKKPLEEATASVPGTFAQGQVVKAADRDNYGWVVSSAKGKTKVHFVSPDGAEKTVALDNAMLTPVASERAPAYLAAKRPLGRMTKAEHEAYLTAQLQEMGVAVPEGAKLADIQEMYLWNKHLRPSIDNWLAQNGGDAAAPEILQQYQKFIDDFTHADKRQTLVVTKTRSGDDKFVSVLSPNRTRRLVRYLKGMPDDVHVNGLFDKSVVQDWFSYMNSLLERMATLKTAHHFLGEPGVVRMASDAARGANDMQLVKAWKDAGFDKRGLQAFIGSQPELLKQMGTMKVDDFINNLYLQEGAESTLKAFGEVVKPKTENALIKGFDKLTSLYKGALTVPWPSFHVRNLASGLWQSWSDGKVGLSDLMAGYMKAIKHAAAKYGKSTGEGGLEYIDEIVNNGILGGHGQLVDILGEAAAERAGKVPDSFLGGLFGAAKAKSPGQAGEHLYSYVEFLNRAGYYEALRKGGYTPSQAMHLVKRSQFDYGAMSAFEKSVMRRAVPFYCVPDHSEILTRDGWKTCDTVREGDEALTYNFETDRLEWQPVLGKAIFDCDQPIMVFESARHRKLEFTHDHRWVTYRRPQTIKHSYGTYHYDGVREVTLGRDLNSGDCIIRAATLSDDVESMLTVSQARLLGWLLTDGYWRWRKGHLEAVLYQHPNKFLEEATATAGGKPRKPHPDTGTITIPVSQELLKPLKEHLRNPKCSMYWVKVVTQLSREAAEAMYDAMYKADGAVGTRTNDFFACQKHGVRDAFQVLCALLGKSAIPNDCGFYISHKRYMATRKGTLHEEHYKGRVWCPQTANGTWVMRQNGAIVITGNSFSRKNIPYQFAKLAERPGGRTAQTIRAYSDAMQSDDGSYTPEFLREGMALRVDGDDSEATFLKQTGIPIEDLNKFVFSGGIPNLARTGEKFAAMMHPLASWLPETWAGKQFYTGRELKNLNSPTEDVLGEPIPFLDRLIHYSPISRAVGEVQGVMDDRKTVLQKVGNALTGLKTGSYDVEKWKLIDYQNAIKELLEENPLVREGQFYYVPEQYKTSQNAPEIQKQIRRTRGLAKAIKNLKQKQEQKQ
jgi:hypothetical protein